MTKFISLTDQLEKFAFQKSAKTAFIFLNDGDLEDSISYYELVAKAQVIACTIKASVRPGERALLLYPAGIDFITAFIACLYAEVIPVPLPSPNNKNLSYILSIASNAGATHALTTSSILSRLETLENRNKIRGYFHSGINLFGKLNITDLKWHATDNIQRFEPTHTKLVSPKENNIAYLQYTSGSTGNPKGVIIDHSNIFYNSQLIKKHFKVSDQTHLVSWLPMYHDMGLVGSLIAPLYAGISTTFLSPTSFFKQPVKWLQAISNSKNLGDTTSGGPGFAYDLCHRKITDQQLSQLDLSNWKQAFIGAEPVRPFIIQKFLERFSASGFSNRAFFPVYGLAESTLLVSAGKPREKLILKTLDKGNLEQNKVFTTKNTCPTEVIQAVGCGHALEGHKIEIVNPATMNLCRLKEVGEIWIKGPSIAKGYWRSDNTKDSCFNSTIHNLQQSGFFRTGDLGFFNDGALFITGRIKDLIFIDGRKLHPQDIEATASNAHPYLRTHSCAAFSIEENDQEKLVIVHEVSTHSQNLEQVAEAIVENIKEQQNLEVLQVIFTEVNKIPKTPNGKLRRQECKKFFESGLLFPILDWSSNSELSSKALLVS